ncbi:MULTISPECIES: hypothetical protein [unclassified Moorena]|uniref:hypothetical protein n=1 Tax=unclassified Moorena TaxID=2683338 RepID=UPI0013B9A6C6|nr:MULTISPECIES: hypothetical protein [unclassified Moorena]NER85949.1 hypothetical protein [Moorena sp. SIO3A2]NES41729.1 hypothetical protein [Moorena sp. SIO2C4]
MFIIDQKEASQTIEWLDKSTIIFQNKLFTICFYISQSFFKKSFHFCGELSEKYPNFYLLVEPPNYLTIWIEQKPVTLADEVSSSPINSAQPLSTDYLSLKAARSEAETPRHLDGKQSRNHNQLATPGLPDSLPEDISTSEASIVTQNPGYCYNPTESDSPATPKLATGNLNQEQEIPESEFHVHPRCQQITEQSLQRLSKKKYRGISYQEQDVLSQLPESELSPNSEASNSEALDQKRSKKTYRGVPFREGLTPWVARE